MPLDKNFILLMRMGTLYKRYFKTVAALKFE